MKKNTKNVVDASTWAASSDLAGINLPREGLITEIKIRFAATMSGNMTTANTDGLYRAIQNLKIEGDGGQSFLGLSGEQAARLLAYWNLTDFGVPLITLQSGTGESVTWVFHPGSNPKDPFDLSAAIPARALATLQAKITTTANSVVDDSQTISSGTYYYEVSHVLEAPVPAGLMVPGGSTLTYAHDANYSDYSKEIDVPGGAFLRRIFILSQDETGTRPARAEDEISGVKLRVATTNVTILQQLWQELKVSSGAYSNFIGMPFQITDDVHGALNLPDGLAVIDLRKYFDPVYGLDLRGSQTGAVKLGLTVANYTSGDDTLLYWDQLRQVDPMYVGK